MPIPSLARALPPLVLLFLSLSLSFSCPAAAQARPDPRDAQAAVPPVVHRPVVAATPRPAADDAVGSWPDANARVVRAGGWRAYAREAQAPAAGASAPVPGHGAHHH